MISNSDLESEGTEQGEQVLGSQPSSVKPPWKPGILAGMAFLFSFAAAGILAGLNWRRLGKPQWMWPTILLSVFGLAGFVAALTFVAGFQGLLSTAGFLINLGLGGLLAYLQNPTYKEWVVANGEHTAKQSGLLTPLIVGVGTIAVVAGIYVFDPALLLERRVLNHYNRGLDFQELGQLDLAIEQYSLALNLDPQLGEAYFNRGLAYYNKGDYDHAVLDYDQFIKLDPQYSLAYINRGLAYHDKGDLERAIADHDQAIALDPQNASAYYNRGNAYSDRGDLDRAIADYDQAVALDPQNALAYYTLGRAYYLKGDLDRAIGDYDQSIELDPQYSLAYNNRGLAHHDKGDLDRAIADYDQAIALDPQNFLAYYNRGRTNYLDGELDRAIADFSKAIEIDASYALGYLLRAGAYAEVGEQEKAVLDLEKTLELGLDPSTKQDVEELLDLFAQAESPSFPEADLAAVWELPYFDDFSDPTSGWEVGDYDFGTVGYEGGVYAVTSTDNGIDMWGVAYQSFEDVEITVQARQVSGPTNNNNGYGVACRVGQGSIITGYFFRISGDGFFAIFREGEDSSIELVPWTESDSVRMGNDVNRIGAVCSGEELSLYINGRLAASVQDNVFRSGDVALSAVSFEDEATEIHFDDFELKRP